jgi:hypothetical protein
MKRLQATISMLLVLLAVAAGAGCSEDAPLPPPGIVVNSVADLDVTPKGTVTLRSALRRAVSGQPIRFDPSLDGRTIELSLVAEEHTTLKGEVMGIRIEPSGPVSYLIGYLDRDYGRSALFARKNVVIDASMLPSGITIAWAGGAMNHARLLAVYGDLTLINVSMTRGSVVTEDISAGDPNAAQPFTLARGGAVAVWGVAKLVDCQIYDNHVQGDFFSSRDRGAFGGGVYADIVRIEDSVISGNTVVGAGAAGGGVYSVGGAGSALDTSRIERSAITGNRISGLFTYGGGVYSDGGGIGNRKRLEITNSTIAQNLVEPAPGLPPFLLAMGYWRGGGVYMSNGYTSIQHSTIVHNQVHGVPRTDSLSRPNLAGGVAATIGNAHAVEDLLVGHSIIAGNTVQEIGGITYPHDIFTGSLFYFRSMGHNRIGVIDFSQMLVPVGRVQWRSLSRRHYPKVGDQDGVAIGDVPDVPGGIAVSPLISSAGVDAPDPVAVHYEPRESALGQAPALPYDVDETLAEYVISPPTPNDFLEIVLDRIESHYNLPGFASDLTTDFEAYLQSVDLDDQTPGLQPYLDPVGDPILTLADALWFGPAQTWPKELANHPYIEFWHRLERGVEAISGMGPELLGDVAWATLFSSGALAENPGIVMRVLSGPPLRVDPLGVDQRGAQRPASGPIDIGAIELP